jgi:hypothetical protein
MRNSQSNNWLKATRDSALLFFLAHCSMKRQVTVVLGIVLVGSIEIIAEAQTNTLPMVLLSNGTNSGIPQQTQTSSNQESPVTGREVWSVSGTNYDIQGTALLTMGNGQTMFVVKALCDFTPGKAHKPLAQSLARYAVDHGYLAKLPRPSGAAPRFSEVVGVALMQKPKDRSSTPSSGYRYSFALAEIGATNSPGEQSGAASGSPAVRAPSGYGVLAFDKPSSRWPLLHLEAPKPGAERYLLMLFFTNALSPGLRSTAAISESMKFEWHKVAKDGTASASRGVVPTSFCNALMSEWAEGAGRTNLDVRLEQAVYVGASDGVHPGQVQRLLDYMSKQPTH